MNKVVAVCLGICILASIAVSSPKIEAFALADRVGDPRIRAFFRFSTSAGKYTIRHDGMGEVASPGRFRRVFHLKMGAKGHVERVYFLEHEGDLFLLYEVHDASSAWAYLVRMDQAKRKPIWLTPVTSGDIQAPIIEGNRVIIKSIEISKADGEIVGS